MAKRYTDAFRRDAVSIKNQLFIKLHPSPAFSARALQALLEQGLKPFFIVTQFVPNRINLRDRRALAVLTVPISFQIAQKSKQIA